MLSVVYFTSLQVTTGKYKIMFKILFILPTHMFRVQSHACQSYKNQTIHVKQAKSICEMQVSWITAALAQTLYICISIYIYFFTLNRSDDAWAWQTAHNRNIYFQIYIHQRVSRSFSTRSSSTSRKDMTQIKTNPTRHIYIQLLKYKKKKTIQID